MTPDPTTSVAAPAGITPPRRSLSQPAYAMGGDLLLGLDPLCLLAVTWLTTWGVLQAHGWTALPAGLTGDALLWGWLAALLAPFVLFDRRFGQRASRGQTGPLVRTHLLRLGLLGTLLLVLAHLGGQPTRLPTEWLGLWLALAGGATLLTRIGLARAAQGLARQGRLTETVAVVGGGPTARRLLRQLQAAPAHSVEVLGVFDDRSGAASGTGVGRNGNSGNGNGMGNRSLDNTGVGSNGLGAQPRQGDRRAANDAAHDIRPGGSRRGSRAAPGGGPPDGTIAELLALGARRHIDWIVLTLPPGDGRRVRALVQRLKSLSVPIALCPQQLGLALAMAPSGHVGHTVPVTLLGHGDGWRDASADAGHDGNGGILPRWLGTLAQLAVAGGRALAGQLVHTLRAATLPQVSRPAPFAPFAPSTPSAPSATDLARPTFRFDDHDLDSFAALAGDFGQQRYGYVVTPNTDHLIRLRDERSFRALYADAAYVLLDSRVVARLLRFMRGVQVSVCPGSDLTARLFERVIGPDDPVVLIGASAAQAEQLRTRHGLHRLAHHNPPMGFIHDAEAVETCLRFVEAHSPFRYCLLALGSPQQEVIAQRLRERGRARGLALCIGASVDFLTGAERRAPRWMQLASLEWLYRLLQSPRRLAGRYLVRGPRIVGVLRDADIALRPSQPITHPTARPTAHPNANGRGDR